MSIRLLDEVEVRLAASGEYKEIKRLMDDHHYLGWGRPVGETLIYVAEAGGKWVALLVFGAAAYALKGRDELIGWTVEQRRARLNFIAQNRRFLILPDCREKNLASRVLGLCMKRLSDDWQAAHGHPVILAETFVDPQRFEGTCYLAAGWRQLGLTVGARRVRRDFYDEAGSPKNILVKPLRTDACQLLSGATFPEAWQEHEMRVIAPNPLNGKEAYSLYQAFKQVPDFRSAHGLRHPLAAILACATCALMAGAEGVSEMAEIVAGFDQRQLRLLHCWHNWKTKRYECPSENTIRRALHGIDPLGFDRIVGDWTRAHNKVGALAIDGKTLKACLDADRRQTTLVAAVAHGDGAPLAQMPVPAGTNETATARNLIDLLPPLDGVLATFDAAHTNGETARKVVIEKGGDYPVPTYQWQFSTNGSTYVNIGGATSPGYLIISSALTDIGFYRVMASNSQGTNYSGTVTLGCIDLKMLAAVYLTGPIGGNYRIDAASVLTPSNWVTLTNISLPTQPYIHVDYTSATNKQQFYRAVPQ